MYCLCQKQEIIVLKGEGIVEFQFVFMIISKRIAAQKDILELTIYIYQGVDVVEWSRAMDVGLSEWCCSVSMV